LTWKPLDDDHDPRPVGASLDAIAQRLGAPKASALTAIFDRWTDVVGAAIAAHAQPRTLKKGTLVIAVDDPAWASELRFRSDEIAERCSAVAGSGTVAKIEVRVVPRWSS
jgi:predicted nucleic acid-binding Zn ribbon protein